MHNISKLHGHTWCLVSGLFSSWIWTIISDFHNTTWIWKAPGRPSFHHLVKKDEHNVHGLGAKDKSLNPASYCYSTVMADNLLNTSPPHSSSLIRPPLSFTWTTMKISYLIPCLQYYPFQSIIFLNLIHKYGHLRSLIKNSPVTPQTNKQKSTLLMILSWWLRG